MHAPTYGVKTTNINKWIWDGRASRQTSKHKIHNPTSNVFSDIWTQTYPNNLVMQHGNMMRNWLKQLQDF